jgi:hypothetical protein
VLLRVLGTDASKQFDQFHNKAVLEQYQKLQVGDIGAEAAPPPPPAAAAATAPAAAASESSSSLLDEPFGDLVPFGDPSWYSDWCKDTYIQVEGGLLEAGSKLPRFPIDSPYYNDSHRRLRAAVRAFVDKEITPNCFAWDEAKQIPKSLFLKAAEAGILAGMCG